MAGLKVRQKPRSDNVDGATDEGAASGFLRSRARAVAELLYFDPADDGLDERESEIVDELYKSARRIIESADAIRAHAAPVPTEQELANLRDPLGLIPPQHGAHERTRFLLFAERCGQLMKHPYRDSLLGEREMIRVLAKDLGWTSRCHVTRELVCKLGVLWSASDSEDRWVELSEIARDLGVPKSGKTSLKESWREMRNRREDAGRGPCSLW